MLVDGTHPTLETSWGDPGWLGDWGETNPIVLMLPGRRGANANVHCTPSCHLFRTTHA